MEWLFFYVGFTVVIGFLARHKGRDVAGWVVLSLFISPLLAGLILLCLRHKKLAAPTDYFGWGVRRVERNGKKRWLVDDNNQVVRFAEADAKVQALTAMAERTTHDVVYVAEAL